MSRKQRRSIFILTGLGTLALAVGLVLFALQDNLVFFHSPSDIVEKGVKPGERIRLGGLVAEGSVKRGEGTAVSFTITDTDKSIPVSFIGVLPDLFREGQGVIAEGKLTSNGSFSADTVLAKHDEKYMPPEVAEALKKKGVFRGEEKKK